MPRKSDSSAESSARLASLAGDLLDHDDPRVRSLAGSVLRQFEVDTPDLARVGEDRVTLEQSEHPRFWEGVWHGLWLCRR